MAAAVAAAPLLGGCVVATSSRSGGGGGGFFFLLLPLFLFFMIARMARRSRRGPSMFGGGIRGMGGMGGQRMEPMQPADPPISAGMLRAELSVLADDVLRLEPQVALREEARDDYEAATHRYRVAQTAMDQAQDEVDLVRVQRVVDEARWAMARARAILENRVPPAPPPALQAPGPHGEPAVALDAQQNPVYVGSPEPFRSGWFSAGSGLFGGLLLGSILSGGWGGFGGFGSGDGGSGDGGSGDGEFGGGDFGGGDFGGGEFGGGDF